MQPDTAASKGPSANQARHMAARSSIAPGPAQKPPPILRTVKARTIPRSGVRTFSSQAWTESGTENRRSGVLQTTEWPGSCGSAQGSQLAAGVPPISLLPLASLPLLSQSSKARRTRAQYLTDLRQAACSCCKPSLVRTPPCSAAAAPQNSGIAPLGASDTP
jgi:hypothetical protein